MAPVPSKRTRTNNYGPQIVDPLAAGTPAPAVPSPAGAEPTPTPVPQPTPPLPPMPGPAPDPAPSPGPGPTQPAVPSPVGRPVAESELTPDQRRIRALEDQLARERGRKDVEPELVVPAQPGARDNIVIHFLEDGFTALGKVWYRGQEIEFEPNGPAYGDTCDRHGRSWLDLRDDEFAQVERYGKIMFRSGPWPGRKLTDDGAARFEKLRALGGDAPVGAPTPDELAAAEAAEAKRRRAAPRLPVGG